MILEAAKAIKIAQGILLDERTVDIYKLNRVKFRRVVKITRCKGHVSAGVSSTNYDLTGVYTIRVSIAGEIFFEIAHQGLGILHGAVNRLYNCFSTGDLVA